MDKDYQVYQEEKLRQYEALCKRCGACCGAFEDDPCEHLFLSEENKFACDIYENRFGLRKTKSGREFICVPIRQILFKSWLGSWRCSYKINLTQI